MSCPSTISKRARPSISAAFFIQGMLLAAILTELPAIRADMGAGDGLLALLIGVISLLAAGGSIVAEKFAEKKDSATVLMLGIATEAVGALLITLNQGMVTFVLATIIYGLGLGGVDAAGNMQAAALQNRVGKVILSSFFAAWSAGAIVGAVAVSLGEGLSMGYRVNIAVVAVAVAIIGLVASPNFLRYGHEKAIDHNPVHALIPWRPVVALGIAMALFYVVDFGLSNWSTLFLHDILLADVSTAALGVAAYQIAGLVSRLTADFWTRRFGAVRVMRVAAVVAMAGMLATITAQNVPGALVGLAIVGLGASVTAPLCFSSAAALSQKNLDAVIARLNLFNYAGTVVGGVVIGTLLAATNARVALIIPLISCVLLIFSAPWFGKRVASTHEMRHEMRTSTDKG
ncbi:MFS transporter [Corynebacterium sp. 4HC-13]|uniref:MFS transporter n=1 Tax=Corynebacterium anserum TaxID=2684406 RepID=UPI00163AA027|nr:MFS transporter [Corynebacterium anserum]MBC2681361.1 MFS transporter [Corynebacterium anserum]